jgi:hypothetical protein
MKWFAMAALGVLTGGDAGAAPLLCLDSYRIDHTSVPDDSTILFFMRDRTVYRAHLINRCVGLSLDPRGFTYDPIPGNNQICENLFSIHLNTYGGVCLVGKIEKMAGQH